MDTIDLMIRESPKDRTYSYRKDESKFKILKALIEPEAASAGMKFERIRELTKLSSDALTNNIKELCSNGYIEKTEGDNRQSPYKITPAGIVVYLHMYEQKHLEDVPAPRIRLVESKLDNVFATTTSTMTAWGSERKVDERLSQLGETFMSVREKERKVDERLSQLSEKFIKDVRAEVRDDMTTDGISILFSIEKKKDKNSENATKS